MGGGSGQVCTDVGDGGGDEAVAVGTPALSAVEGAVGDGGGVWMGDTAVAEAVGEAVADGMDEGVGEGTSVGTAVTVTGNVLLATGVPSGDWQATNSHTHKQPRRL